jgi:hypothetical protein
MFKNQKGKIVVLRFVNFVTSSLRRFVTSSLRRNQTTHNWTNNDASGGGGALRQSHKTSSLEACEGSEANKRPVEDVFVGSSRRDYLAWTPGSPSSRESRRILQRDRR